MPEPAAERIGSLDLIRGLAVLGILAINIGGFAGPSLATLSPNLPYPGGAADEMSFAVNFLLFEGKMRALFSMLFGASLLLLIERNDEQGRFGIGVQVRRLSWLALFGLAHFYVLWWGDILFGYAVAGFFALLLSEIAPRRLAIAAVAIFTIWHASGAAVYAPNVMLENAVLAGEATPGQSSDYAKYLQDVRDYGVAETEAMQGSFAAQVVYRFTQLPLQPFTGALEGLGETLPLMMLGMALLGSGFFAGRWRGRTMALMAAGGISGGLALTALILALVWPRGFPPTMMDSAINYWTALPHLLMALGYAALLVLVAPRLANRVPGRWLMACGKMAFSNYIGTTVLMTWIFYGWGLGWIGRFGNAWQWLFVVLGWAVMVVFSNMWLARFRRGPLEWLWRSLVEWRMLENRR